MINSIVVEVSHSLSKQSEIDANASALAAQASATAAAGSATSAAASATVAEDSAEIAELYGSRGRNLDGGDASSTYVTLAFDGGDANG